MNRRRKEEFMARAVALAMRGKGTARPNPCVGAVLVRDGEVVAKGWHTACGRPHAEVEALADAARKGIDTRECTLFVTLEPCNHHGKTPPCTRAILNAGIPRVIVGTRDPNAEVEGGGNDFLRRKGVEVECSVLEQECRDLIADFLIWQTTERPCVTLKLASTLDGRIATRTGHSAWVSGPESRKAVHKLRARMQAVLVGGETFRKDNPSLTCRLDDFSGPQPLAVVVTSTLPDPHTRCTLLEKRAGETVFLTTEAAAESDGAQSLRDLGCRVWGLATDDQGLMLEAGLKRLRQETGTLDLLCEGGGRLAMSLLSRNLVDELHLFLAMKILGDTYGAASFAGREVLSMHDCVSFRRVETTPSGEDLFLRLMPR
jgi:diaminohydroxyphosphoribosylaminopyrimidine deaminase/5-amino-6-(5-phosphoribosylamino)uracil reductase